MIEFLTVIFIFLLDAVFLLLAIFGYNELF